MKSSIPSVSTGRALLTILLLVVITSACFANSVKNPLLNWDDQVYIKGNPYIRELSWSNLKSLFTQPYFKNYAPLHLLSYSLDYHFFKLRPEGYRLINICLHIFNSILIFFLILEWYQTYQVALTGAAIFAVHTIHVESVVWLSQRKDVLSAFFFLVALYGYIQFRKKVSQTQARYRLSWYGFSLVIFVLALLTKPIAVSLPLVLMLDEFCFRKGRILWKNKIPFFLLAILAAIATCWAQSVGTGIKEYVGHSFFLSLLLTGKIIVLYLGKLLIPIGLSSRYVFPVEKFSDLLTPYTALCWLLCLIFLATLSWLAWKRKKELAFPGCWFLITLLPVANLVPTSTQMADRYLYLPSLGYGLAIGLLIHSLNQRTSRECLSVVGLSVAVIFYGSLTWARNRVWASDRTLWADALATDPNNYYAAAYLANTYLIEAQKKVTSKKHNLRLAQKLFQQGIRIKKDFAPACLGLASVLIEEKKSAQAIPLLLEAQKHNDEQRQSPRIEHNLGIAYLRTNQVDAAQKAFIRAIKQDPTFTPAYLSLGTLYFQRNSTLGYKMAAEQYLRAIKVSPEDPLGYFYLAMARERLRDFSLAIYNYHQALRLAGPRLIANVHLNLAGLYYRLQDYPKAVKHYQQLLRLDPNHPQADAVRSILKSFH